MHSVVGGIVLAFALYQSVIIGLGVITFVDLKKGTPLYCGEGRDTTLVRSVDNVIQKGYTYIILNTGQKYELIDCQTLKERSKDK